MQEVFFLSSMDDTRFSAVFRCEVDRPIELPNGHHALMVSCDPPANGQELGHPLGISKLLLWSRFEDEDPWTFPAFPHFVQICLPDVDLPAHAMPASIAWGEIYETEADAHAHEMSARPSTEAGRDAGSPRGARKMNELAVEDVPLLLVGETVDAVWVDYALRLLFSNGARVILECPFSIGRTPDTAATIDPEGDKSGLVPALRLHTLEVTAAHATGSTLTMTFSDGSQLVAGPHPEFESWHYSGPETPPTMIIMMPGGGPAIWLHHEETEQDFVSFRTQPSDEGLLPGSRDVPTIGRRDADLIAYRVQSLLLAFLDTLPARRTTELRQQAEAVRAVRESAPRVWNVVLAETPRADIADGPLPGSLAYRTDESPLAGEVLVRMLDGRIDSVELPWFTTEMPTALPTPDQLIRTAVEGGGGHGVR